MKYVPKKVSSACASFFTLDEDFGAYSIAKSAMPKHGRVRKRGGYSKGWRYSRYFMHESEGTLMYFSRTRGYSRMVNKFKVRRCHSKKTSRISVLEAVSDSQPSTHEKVLFNNLEPLNLLGAGSFGRVYLCRDRETSKHYAVKKLVKERIVQRKLVKSTKLENRILQSISHPFLISLEHSYQDDRNLYFVMEFANGGDFFHHLKKRSPTRTFPEDLVRFYSAELTLALMYLHDQGIIYRDLKLENLLLDRDGHVKIVDFGLSKDGMNRKSRTMSFCGTNDYLAPEVIYLLDEPGYGFPADWWSLGIVVYEMVMGRTPFYSESYDEMYRMIRKNEPVFSDENSPECEDLIRGLLAKDPRRRLGGPEVMSHKFFAAVDWIRMNRREVTPPFVPELSSDLDLRYFDAEFTEQNLDSFSHCSEEDVRTYTGDEFDDFDYTNDNQD